MPTDSRFFPYRLDQRWALLFKALGVGESDGVHLLGDGGLRATYGRVQVETPMSNVDHTLVTTDHRWFTAVGLRLSFADSGLTFGTNHRAGLCIAFLQEVPRVIGRKNHSALWVSVADPEGLATAIGR